MLEWRVLVCGSREYKRERFLWTLLDYFAPTVVITGGANGADNFAEAWAMLHSCPCLIYKADWSIGKSAGPIRNQQMIDEGKPNMGIAFPLGSSPGTRDMVARLHEHKIRTVVVEEFYES